ncbi:MAG TPA: pitrilysin family protein [Burkholderiales bacterium]|nr:pitrilysin family protein [Burkholderiales bacterium]
MTSASRRLLAAIAAAACLIPALACATLPIEHWRTAAGARVLFVQTHDLPMLDVAVDFPAGASRDVPDKSGAASLTLSLMRGGAGGLGEDEISEKLGDVGAELSSRFDMDRAGYGLRTLSSGRERVQALSVLATVLQQPDFPQEVFAREQQRTLASLREAETRPEVLADREFRRLVYGSHPYSMRGAGEVETVEKLGRDDIVAYYHGHYFADDAVVSIIGDLSRDEAADIAEQLTSRLARRTQPLQGLPAPVPLQSARLSRIAHPATQAHILIGQPGMSRLDPDYFPLFLGNYVLGGGGFASRLNEEIRQKRGYAYSAYSFFMPLAVAGVFQIAVQTKREQSEEALKVAQDTLERFVADGPTQQELEAAKQNIVGGFALRTDSNRKILDYLATIGFYGLPLTYLDDFPARIEQVTLDEVRQAWRRRIHPDRMATVVVAGGAPATDAR